MTLNPIEQDPEARECHVCGNTVPVSSLACPYCGTTSLEAGPAAREAAAERNFIQAMFTRPSPFTMIILGVNLGAFVLEWLAGGMGVMSVDHDVLVGFGAKVNPKIVEQHQYWRLVTSDFLHIGFAHFILNNYALWIIGREIEQIYGSARFVILYFVTGVIASLTSFYFSPASTSAGASGSIFGLFGVMAAFAFRYRSDIPARLAADLRRRVLPVIGINLLFGFTARGVVDNAAHIGGLIAGILLALVIPFKRPGESATGFVWRALQIACLALVFGSFVAAFWNYDGPRLALANLTKSPDSRPSVVSYFEGMRVAYNSLLESTDEVQKLAGFGRLAADLNRAQTAAERGIDAAKATPTLDSEAESYRTRLIDLLSEQRDIVRKYQETASATGALAQAESSEARRATEFGREFIPWLYEFMKKNGYPLSNPAEKRP